MPTLLLPDVAARESYLSAMDEFVAEGRTDDGSMMGTDIATWAPRWADPEVFAEYVTWLRAQAATETPRAAHLVPSTTWWWVEPDGHRLAFLGRIALRHRLNQALLDQGGHIGYDVRRSRRREGHATAMLGAALTRCPEFGLARVLVTCDSDNLGSRRVIESHGGVLEDQRGAKLRFWIDLH